MRLIRHLQVFEERHRDLAFELVRIYLGLGLMAKGIYFAGNISEVLVLVEGGAWNIANMGLAHYVVWGHVVGGLLLVIGFFTRASALVQIPILIGAVMLVHLPEGLFQRQQNLEFSLLVLFLLCLVAFHGGGRLSVDQRLFGSAKKRLEEEEMGDQAPAL